MRRLSRIYEPLAELAAPRFANHASSQYVCRTCLRQKMARAQLPPSSASAQFSTSTRRSAGLTDKLKGFTSAIKGETSMFDAKKEEKDDSYQPADNWDGLEWLGTQQWYEDQKRPQEAFESFGHINAPLTDRNGIRDQLLRAIVEVHSIRLMFAEDWQTALNSGKLPADMAVPKGIRIGCDAATQEPRLQFESDASQKEFINVVRQRLQDDSAAEEIAGLDEGQDNTNEANFASTSPNFNFADLEGSSHETWSSISLDDITFRFAVAKRVQQRTGIRLSDPQISRAKSAGAMFIHLWTPEKPKKLAEGLLSSDNLTDLPNVKIADHRITFVHKEREVGRWKVIEEELNERGIPPLGRPDLNDRNARSD